MMITNALLVVTLHAIHAVAFPLSGPTVPLDGASAVGVNSGAVQKFLGIPFAQPPVGNLRFRLPQSISYPNGTVYDATEYGLSCIQQTVQLPLVSGLAAEAADFIIGNIFGSLFPDAEDCLTINVIKPKTATPASRLPVVVWIFGGGFQLGATTSYDGTGIVTRSQELGSPVVYVSMNYRLAGLRSFTK